MSGHNKWSQIKHRKGAADASKSNVWGKLSKRISVESKKANGDVNTPHLRAVIEKARESNMPKENIDRAVAKGISADSGSLDTVVYETYGPGGVAILIETLTDNHNRTAQEIKHLLLENGLALASPGSAMWAFGKRPMVTRQRRQPRFLNPTKKNFKKFWRKSARTTMWRRFTRTPRE